MIKKLFFLIFCLLFQSAVFAQTPTPAKEEVVVINTDLIQVDATVTDKSGRIIADLTADDFEIYENEKKQPITNFSFVELQPDKSTRPTTEKLNKSASTSTVAAPPISTRLKPEQVRRTLALVVDDLCMSFESVDVVRSALKKFVDEQMQPGDLVAIIRTSKGAGGLQQFASDKQMLYAAIKKVSWSPLGRCDPGVFQALDPSNAGAGGLGSMAEVSESQKAANQVKDQIRTESERDVEQLKQDIFTVGTLGTVNYVVGGMGELPGRKAVVLFVVLFSDGFRLYETYLTPIGVIKAGIKDRLITSFQRLTDLANRSGVIIYALDPRGVVNPMLTAEDNATSGAGSIGRSEALFDTQQGLKVLAEQTGGFAVINNNNLAKGVERILNDQKGYYLIGYQPDDETFDPKKARFNKRRLSTGQK